MKNASRSSRAIFGFVTDIIGTILILLSSFFIAPIILQYTSQTLYGFWLTTTAILGFLALTDFGIGMPLIRAIAASSNLGSEKELNRIISTGFLALCFVGLLFFLMGIALSFFVGSWFKIPSSEQEHILPAYYIALLSASLALPLSIFSIILNGFQRMAVDNTVRNTIGLCGAASTIVFLYTGFGLMAIAISNLLVILVTTLINYFYAKRSFSDLSIRLSLFDKQELKNLLKFGGYFQIGRIATTITASADNVIIAGVLGASYVTPYSLTSKLPVLFSVNLASKLPNAAFPAASQMFAEGDFKKLQIVFVKLATLSTRLAVMSASFVFIANEQFIALWVGQNNYGGLALNLVFVYWILQDAIYRSTTALLFASGDLRNWTIASIFEAILNITISVILVRMIGVVGVALGTSISKTLTTGISTPYFISKKLGMSFTFFLRSGILVPFLKSLPTFILAWAISKVVPMHWGWTWILLVGLSIGLSNFIIFEARILFFSPADSWKERIKNVFSFGVNRL